MDALAECRERNVLNSLLEKQLELASIYTAAENTTARQNHRKPGSITSTALG